MEKVSKDVDAGRERLAHEQTLGPTCPSFPVSRETAEKMIDRLELWRRDFEGPDTVLRDLFAILLRD